MKIPPILGVQYWGYISKPTAGVLYGNKWAFIVLRENACHCEEGEARRGNLLQKSAQKPKMMPSGKRAGDCHTSVRTGSQ